MSQSNQQRKWWSRWLVALGSSLWFWPILWVRTEPVLQGTNDVVFQPVAIFTALALIVIYRSPRLHIKPQMVVTAGLVLGICSLLRFCGTPQALWLVVDVLRSVSSAIIVVAWIARQSLEGRYIATIVATSLFLPFLYNWLLSFAPNVVGGVFLIVAPLVSTGLWLADRHTRYPGSQQDIYRQNKEQINESTGELTLGSYRISTLKLTILMLFTIVEAGSMTANSQLMSQQLNAGAPMGAFPWMSAVFCIIVFIFDSRHQCEARSSVTLMWLCPAMTLGLVFCILTESIDLPQVVVSTALSFVAFASIFSVQYLVMHLVQQEGLSPVLAQGMALLLFAFIDCAGVGLGLLSPGSKVLQIVVSMPVFRLIEIFVLATIPVLLCLDLLRSATEADSIIGKARIPALEDTQGQLVSTSDNASRIALFSTAYALSPRETEVFEKVLTGRSGPMIARELFVTTGTIKTHLQHIYAKTGAEGRYDLLEMFEKFQA